MNTIALTRTHAALAAAIAGSLVVRLWTISERSFWFDEAFSYTLARESTWLEMLQRTAGDVHPPLSYAALCAWSHLAGTSVVGLRLFSVFWSVLTMAGCYLFCRDALNGAEPGRAASRADACWTGVSAAALIGACSLHIKWSQEARMYTMGTALVFFSTWALVRALRARTRGKQWWCAYAVLAAAFAYIHNFALFSIVGQALFCLGVYFRRLIRSTENGARSGFAPPGLEPRPLIQDAGPSASADGRHERVEAESCASANAEPRWQPLHALLAFAAVGVAYLPWLHELLGQTDRAEVQYWTPPMSGWTVMDSLGGLIVPTNSPGPAPEISIASTAAFLALLGLLMCVARPGSWILTSMMVTPVACATAVSLVSVPVFVSRYFLFAYMFALCALPYLIARFVDAPYRTALVCALVANSLAGHWFFWSSLDTGSRPGVGGAAAYVKQRLQPEDEVVVMHPTIYFSMRYYLRGIAAPRLFVPEGRKPHYMGGSAVTRDWIIDEEQLRRATCQRVWVLETTGYLGSMEWSMPLGDWENVPASSASFRDVYWFQRDVTATAYERRKPSDSAGENPRQHSPMGHP